MASNPFGITQVDAPGLLQMYTGLQRQGLEDQYRRAAFERQQKADARSDVLVGREDADFARAETARGLIAKGAKPEEVIAADPTTGFSYATHAAAIEKSKREEQAKRADDVGSAAVYLSSLPEKDMAVQWDSVIDKLVAQGYTDLAAYKGKPNREALGPIIADSEKAVTAYIAHMKDSRDAAHREKHDSFMEGIARRNSDIGAGNLGLARTREARVAKWGPQPLFGGAAIPMPTGTPPDNSDLNY